jgi:hypothetical protein
MTIRKGEQWGTLATPPTDLSIARSDAELRTMALRDDPPSVIGLLGGDVMRTLGGLSDESRLAGAAPIPHLPIDAVRVRVDDERETVFVAHLVARASWWRGAIVAFMNAQFRGSWDVAPRSHPNDGKVDIVTVDPSMSLQQRWLARSRVRLGTHVPHPLITVTQRSQFTIDLVRSMPLWVDGERWGSGRHIELSVEPDALVVCV